MVEADERNLSKKSFHFTNETDLVLLSCSSSDSSVNSDTDIHVCGTDCVNIVIFEILNPSYGLYVWPSAPVLAQYIWKNQSYIHRKTVLELGAGTALPSVVAAKCGAYVIVSDGENFSQTIDCGKYNMELNKIPAECFKISEITWGLFSPALLTLNPVNIILGSDVFYEPDDFEDIIVTVSYLFQKNKDAEFWFSYQERNSDWSIEHLLQEWNISSQEIPLESFGATEAAFSSWNISLNQKVRFFILKSSKKA